MNFWKQWPYPAKMALAFFLFFLATLGFAVFRGKSSHPRIPIESLATTPVEQTLWENKPKVVYFWATWCSVCKTYSYILDKNLKLLGKDTIFLSVVEDEDSSELQKYLIDHHIKYPVLSGNYQMLQDWGVSAFPTTVFLNRKGEVLFFDTGIISPISFWVRSFLTELW
jgi:thiol-disulfide isomerase/thioredoxin